MRKITKRAAAITTVAVVGVGALGATAYANGWILSDTKATVSTASAGTLAGTITFSTPLAPTGSSDVIFNLKNTNAFNVKITGITLTAANLGRAGCTPDSSGITFTSPNVVLAKNAKEASYKAVGIAHMSEYASDTCVGLSTSDLPVTLTGIPTTETPSTALSLSAEK